jgi:type III pantothenate kinase
MRLAIDVGNTRIKWAFGQGGAQAVEHRGRDLRTLLRHAWTDQPRPEAIHVASVAGEAVDEAIRQVAQDCWPGVSLTFLAPRAEWCGVQVAYARPERFGVDRLAALVAAHAGSAGVPVVVVDAGTAVTVDALDAQGRHLGGVIMPGLRLLQTCLLAGTAGVADARDTPPPLDWTGGMGLQTSTEAGVAAGTHWMFLGGALRAIEAACRQAGEGAHLYLTGGDAAILAQSLGCGYLLRPDLVLEGIALMAQAG